MKDASSFITELYDSRLKAQAAARAEFLKSPDLSLPADLEVAISHPLPIAPMPALSLYADGDDSEWTRIDREAREVLRLDGLLRTRDEELRAQHGRVEELRAMVEYRNGVIAERDRVEAALRADFASALEAERAAHAAERMRLVREIEAQERIVAYRASIGWWLRLPLVLARRAWIRIRPA